MCLLWVLRGYYEFSRVVFPISEAKLKNAGTIFERSTVANDISPRLLFTYTYQEIASQLFVSTKTVYRTYETFINTGDVKLCVLGRPNNNYL